jgi:hypothetical protein
MTPLLDNTRQMGGWGGGKVVAPFPSQAGKKGGWGGEGGSGGRVEWVGPRVGPPPLSLGPNNLKIFQL